MNSNLTTYLVNRMIMIMITMMMMMPLKSNLFNQDEKKWTKIEDEEEREERYKYLSTRLQ
jgi:hypothetical protein